MCLFGSGVSLVVGLNNEGFDMLGNVLLLVSGVMLNMRSFFTVSLTIWLLWHQIFCLNSNKTVLYHVICMTIAHKFCYFFDHTEFSFLLPC